LHVSWDCSYWRDGRDFNDNPRPDFTFSFDTAFFLVKQYLRKLSFDGRQNGHVLSINNQLLMAGKSKKRNLS
jgi:hypothetical protein